MKVERPDGRGSTLYAYDLDGALLRQVTETADATDLWETLYTYDATGRVTGVAYADGTSEQRTYRPDSQVATVLTRDGVTVTFQYDAANRLESVIPSAGAPGTTRLDAGDAYAYDELSRPTQLQRGRPGVGGFDPALSVAYPTYDLASRPAAEVVGARDPLSWTYDVFSNPVETRLPAGPGRDAAGPTSVPATVWGDFGYGWRGNEGTPSDGAKIGRQVLGSGTDGLGLLAGLGWSWGYDNGVRLTEATSWTGDLQGNPPPSGEPHDRFTFTYGPGDELLSRLREVTGETTDYQTGDYGRITSRNGQPFTYDGVGRRLEDDRFVYRWDWRGQLVSVTVKPTWPDENNDGEPDASPYAGHHVRYDYDATGRLTHRLHEGEEAADGTRPFIEERQYVWEGDRLAAEAAYAAPDATNLRWRRTYVPGPSGLDDPTQVVVEIAQPGSPYSGTTRTYTYLRDELGTVMGLVAEDEGTDPSNPPIPIRYRYTPYGEAHAETGPELLRAHFDGDSTAVETTGGPVTQTVADDTLAAPGALVLDWSLPLAEASWSSGLIVEHLVAGTGWTPVDPAQVAIGPESTGGVSSTGADGELLVLLTDGWEAGRSYRVRLKPTLTDTLARPFGRAETLEWSVPAGDGTESVPTVTYDQRFPVEYESWKAAGASVGGRFPAGQSRLFQGVWTDPVTGNAYARARWYDVKNGAFLTEDPMEDIDSPNLYAFVAWNPASGRDPLGTERIVLPPDMSVDEAERLRTEDPERFADIISRPGTRGQRRLRRGYEKARARLMESPEGRAAALALENREERLYLKFDPSRRGSLVVKEYQIRDGKVVAASLTIGPDWSGDIPPGKSNHYPYGITLNDSTRLLGVYKVAHEEHGHFVLALDNNAYKEVFLQQEKFRDEVQDPAKAMAAEMYPDDPKAQGLERRRLIGEEAWEKAQERKTYLENAADQEGKELTEAYKDSLGFWARLFL